MIYNAMRNLRDVFSLEESYAPSVHLDMALESAIDGNKNSMNYHLTELLYDELSQIPNSNNTNYAFRFTKIPRIEGKTIEENPVVLDILNNSLIFIWHPAVSYFQCPVRK